MAARQTRGLSLPLRVACDAHRCGPTASMSRARPFSQLRISASRPKALVCPRTDAVGSKVLIPHRTLFTRSKPRPVRKAIVWTLLAFGATFGVAYHLDSRSAIHRWIAIPILQATTDPETAQKLAVKLLSLGIMPRDLISDDEVLAAEVSGS